MIIFNTFTAVVDPLLPRPAPPCLFPSESPGRNDSYGRGLGVRGWAIEEGDAVRHIVGGPRRCCKAVVLEPQSTLLRPLLWKMFWIFGRPFEAVRVDYRVSGARFIKVGTWRQKEKERSHFQKGLISLGSSSGLVPLPGKKAPDLVHGVVSLFEVRLENLTPS